MRDRAGAYQQAVADWDFEAMGKLRHPDYQCRYPQSGECFFGHDTWVAAHRDYMSHFPQDDISAAKVKGGRRTAEVAKQASPLGGFTTPVVLVSGTGDLATMEGKGVWPDGKTYHWVRIIEFRDGLVWRETEYFAEPFPAPDWRSPYVGIDPAD